MSGYLPSSLPPVTAVEVVDLRGMDLKRIHAALDDTSVPWVAASAAAAKRIADLWRQLPPGHSARCHTPPFGLRFVAGDAVICRGSVCWACNNIYGDTGATPFFFAFDASSAVAGELLAELKRAAS